MKKIIYLVSTIFLIFTIGHVSCCFADANALFMGSIQFPELIQTVPSIRIYYRGTIVETETTGHKISFAIPKPKGDVYQQFLLVITEDVQFESGQIPIKYLKIPSNQKYKFYVLEQIKTDASQLVKSSYQSPFNPKPAKKYNENQYTWLIREEKNALYQGIIPDDAIVVRYNPSYIDYIKEGSNSVALPQIMIKKDVVALAGSEANLQDHSITLLLSSLDTDAIHAKIEQQVKQDRPRTRITMVT